MYISTEIADKYQEFFNFMKQEHNLTLTISEMSEIVSEAQKLVKKLDMRVLSKDGVTFCDTNFKCTGCGGTTVLGYCEHGCDD